MSDGNKSYNNIGEILFSQDEILARIDELAVQITSDYEGSQLITVIGVLKGAFLFMADLTRRISLPLAYEFVQIGTYGAGTESSRPPEILFSTGFEARNQRILLVEDIVDTGGTLDYMVRRVEKEKPDDLRVCVLLDKKGRRKFNVKLDYIGFQIPNRFVVGYGLDLSGQYRNLPYLACLAEE